MIKNSHFLRKETCTLMFLLGVFAVLSCGKPPSQREKEPQIFTNPTDVPTNTPVPSKDPGPETPIVQLYLFGAPHCANCEEEIPEMEKRLNAEFGKSRGKIQVTVYVGSGDILFKTKPTLETTEAFKKDLGVHFDFVHDEWKFIKYKYYIGDMNNGLPASVILDSKGNVVKKFVGKKPSVAVDEVMAQLHELVK